jgi:hypothetical protein
MLIIFFFFLWKTTTSVAGAVGFTKLLNINMKLIEIIRKYYYYYYQVVSLKMFIRIIILSSSSNRRTDVKQQYVCNGIFERFDGSDTGKTSSRARSSVATSYTTSATAHILQAPGALFTSQPRTRNRSSLQPRALTVSTPPRSRCTTTRDKLLRRRRTVFVSPSPVNF